MKEKWISIAAVALLVLGAVFLIAERIIPKELADLVPENYSPENAYVHYYEWDGYAEIEGEELQTVLQLLRGLEYRYGGKIFGTMYGELYHVSFFQPVEDGLFDIWITKNRGIVYMNDREYEMVGDTKPLLDFLASLK